MGLYYFILGHYYLVIPKSIQILGKTPYFLNIFNFGQFWPAEIDKKAGRPVKISNPGFPEPHQPVPSCHCRDVTGVW